MRDRSQVVANVDKPIGAAQAHDVQRLGVELLVMAGQPCDDQLTVVGKKLLQGRVNRQQMTCSQNDEIVVGQCPAGSALFKRCAAVIMRKSQQGCLVGRRQPPMLEQLEQHRGEASARFLCLKVNIWHVDIQTHAAVWACC